MTLQEWADKLDIHPNLARTLFIDHGRCPSLRPFNVEEVKAILPRKTARGHIVLTLPEWERVFGVSAEHFKQFLKEIKPGLYLTEEHVFKVRRHVLEVGEAQAGQEKRGFLWGTDLDQDVRRRPKLTDEEGMTILGLEETKALLDVRKGTKFRASLNQWQVLVPGIQKSHLIQHKDGKYYCEISVAKVRRDVQNS